MLYVEIKVQECSVTEFVYFDGCLVEFYYCVLYVSIITAQ